MNKDDDDYYERQTELLEKFLSKNDKTSFMKMLRMNVSTSADKEKEKNHKKRPEFMKSMKYKHPAHIYDYFHMKQHTYSNTNNNNDLFNYNNNYNENQINNFKLDFHNILQDPEYKDKCMKGNYKWASMRFQMMKANLAKRKGISIDEFKMPKIWSKKKNNNKNLYENFDTKKNNFFKQVKSQDKTLNIKEDHKNTFHTDKINKFPNVYKGKYQPLKRLPSHKNPNTFVI